MKYTIFSFFYPYLLRRLVEYRFNFGYVIKITMYDFRETWKDKVASVLNSIFSENGIDEKTEACHIIAETPPNPDMGDIGFPMFSYAKIMRKGPPQIAQMAAQRLTKILADENCASEANAQGPYLNIRLDRSASAKTILENVINNTEKDFSFGRPGTLAGKKIMIEFSSPNTNKPLHLGHLRNDALGESISRILAACAAEVKKVCIINDRGIHICKSMLAYKEQGQGRTPASEKVKSD